LPTTRATEFPAASVAQKRRAGLEARIDWVQKADDRAVDQHHDERARKLEQQLDRLHKAHDRVVDRIATL